MAKKTFTSVAEYLAAQPREVRGILDRVRGAIRKALPKASEVISYQIPAYKLEGRIVIYFAGWKQHYSIYPMTQRLVAAFGDRLEPYEVNNKGTIRFPMSEPVPVRLIADLAKFRAKEAVTGNKTTLTRATPAAFLKQIADPQRRKDCQALVALMREVTGHPPRMWGASIVGFDQYHYKYASGREGDSLLTGFSPRKQDLVLYLGPAIENTDVRARLGRHKAGKGCLYLKKLDDVDRKVLRELIEQSVDVMRQRYPRE